VALAVVGWQNQCLMTWGFRGDGIQAAPAGTLATAPVGTPAAAPAGSPGTSGWVHEMTGVMQV